MELPLPLPTNNTATNRLGEREARLADTLEAIQTMDLTQLRSVWLRNFGPAPALRSVDLLRLTLSWRLQARVYGGLDAKMRRKLKSRGTIEVAAEALSIGTRLTREWQGQIYVIDVVADGFGWNGQVYPSLSAVASAITGTRWNGPKFFGLRETQT